MITRTLSIGLLSAALLLFHTASSSANPNPVNCCECFAIKVLGIEPGGTFRSDPDGSYTAHVKVYKKETSGLQCPTGDYWVSAGAIVMDGEVPVSGTEQGGEVNLKDGSKILKFTLTPDQARLGDGWRFSSVCARSTTPEYPTSNVSGGLDIDGCKQYTIPLEGCEACSKCKYDAKPSGKNETLDTFSPSDSLEGFSASIPTTKSMGGDSSGNLTFYTQSFSNPGREALLANLPTNFAVTRDGQGLVTGINTGSNTIVVAAADPAILALDPNAFTVIHKDPSGNVFRTTTVAFVTESGTERLRMDTSFDGSTTRWEQTRPQPGKLVLEEGNVVNGTFEPLSRNTEESTTPSAGIRTRRITHEERPTAASAWSTTRDTETTWEKQIHGWVKTKEIMDPAGATLTSTWTHYQPGEVTGPGASVEGLGKIKQYKGYDGSESFHTYSLNSSTVTTPYAGNLTGRVVTNSWNPGTQTNTSTTAINGITVSKTTESHTPTTSTRTTYTSATASLTTVTHYIPSGQDFGGKPARTIHPDGTLTTYSYTRNPGGGSTTVTENGSTTDNTTVAKGTRSISTTNSRGTTILSKTEAVGYGTGSAVFSSMAVTSIDSLGRALTTAHHPAAATVTGDVATATGAAWITSTEYSCCGVAKETDMYGITTYHAYDHLQRHIKTNRLGVTTETHHKGLTTEQHRYPEVVAASLSPALNGTATTLVSKSVTNLAGTLRESWSPDPTSQTAGALVKSSSTATTYQPAAGLSTRTVTTTPDNYTQTTDSFLDGRTAATYGDLSPAMIYSYSANATGEFNRQAYVGGSTYYEATGSQSDWAGRTLRSGSLSPGTGPASDLGSCVLQSYVSNEYNQLGQMVKSTDPDGVTTLMAYNAEGEGIITAIDLNANNQIDYGTDTVNSSESDPALDGAAPVMLSISKVWQPGDTDPSGGTIVSTGKSAPNGLSSSSQSIGVSSPSTSLTTLSGNGNWTQKSTSPDGTYSITTYAAGLMDKSENFGSDDTLISSTSMRDASNSPLSGYDDWNRPTHQRDSRTGVSVTAYLSSTADVVKSVNDPGNRTTAFTYDVRGRQITADAPDSLDADGATLTNITNTSYFPDGNVQETSGAQTYRTTHTYDYADRQVTLTTYGTETATTEWKYSPDRGFLTEKNYHGETDDGIADADYTYSAAGRILSRKWERGVTTTYGYDGAGRLTSTDYSDGTPDVSVTYDALGRATQTTNGAAKTIYSYDPANLRIDTETVSYDLDGLNGAEFTRTIARSHDNLGRAAGFAIGTDASATYGYDTAGRLLTVADGTDNFTYGYLANSYGMIGTVAGPVHTVTNGYEGSRDILASRENKAGTTVVSQYGYTVNAIGQRTDLSMAGTAFQAARSVDWGYDSFGQVTKADSSIPGFDRAYLYDEIGNRLKAAEGTTDPDDPSATVYTPNTLNQYSSINNQSSIINPQFDPDGNATAYPLPANLSANSTLTWDGENRLISATVNSITTTYRYDSGGRRIATVASGGTATLVIYDGWNPVAKYTGSVGATPSPSETYLWGMDLSGSMQGAGGVGGLLSVNDGSATYYPTYDGNGNVSEYLDSSGVVQAHYEYDPFGRTTAATGTKAQDFTHRFSTKLLDGETGLYYYGYRYYDPVTGRWPSRDPIGERGGVNLYAFVGNGGVSHFDRLGLDFIAAARTEVKMAGLHLGWHAIIQYWKSCKKLPDGSLNGAWTDRETLVESMPDLAQANSVEVGPDGKYSSVVTWQRRDGKGEDSWNYKKLKLSVVWYDTNKDVEFVPVYEGANEEVQQKWKKITDEAKSYRWAEQDKGLTANFPQSIYGDPTYSYDTPINAESPIPYNNSNTFSRYMLNQANISWESIGSDQFPGLDLPEDVIGDWTDPVSK